MSTVLNVWELVLLKQSGPELLRVRAVKASQPTGKATS